VHNVSRYEKIPRPCEMSPDLIASMKSQDKIGWKKLVEGQLSKELY
jgi:hypothetical protein